LVVSVGAGPLDFRLSRAFVRWALSLAHYRSYRDEYSLHYVRDVVGHRADDPVYPDPAFSLPLPASVAANGHAVERTIGLGLIGYFRPHYWPQEDPVVYQAYLDKMIDLMTWLAGRGYRIVLIRGEANVDEMVLSDVQGALANRGLAQVTARLSLPRIATVEDLLCQLSQTTLVLASRFHNVLLAQHVGKPVLALSYQAKIDALMADTGQGQYCLPIADFEVEALKQRIVQLEAHLEQSTRQIAARRQIYQAQLAEQYERLFGHA
jgi:polysaccharide pyruvyl transferase WcaK-like protein